MFVYWFMLIGGLLVFLASVMNWKWFFNLNRKAVRLGLTDKTWYRVTNAAIGLAIAAYCLTAIVRH